MNEEITQVKFSKEYDGQVVSVVCTKSDFNSSFWDCNFSKISLLNLAHFVVELFNCATLGSAKYLWLHFGNHCVQVERSTETNTFTHYLEVFASKLLF